MLVGGLLFDEILTGRGRDGGKAGKLDGLTMCDDLREGPKYTMSLDDSVHLQRRDHEG